MLSQNVGYRGERAVAGDLFLAYFNADSYNTRLYSYERSLLNLHMPSFYGRVVDSLLQSNMWHLQRSLLSLKAAHTRYFNRDTIGSGTEMINGNKRSDLYFIYDGSSESIVFCIFEVKSRYVCPILYCKSTHSPKASATCFSFVISHSVSPREIRLTDCPQWSR